MSINKETTADAQSSKMDRIDDGSEKSTSIWLNKTDTFKEGFFFSDDIWDWFDDEDYSDAASIPLITLEENSRSRSLL